MGTPCQSFHIGVGQHSLAQDMSVAAIPGPGRVDSGVEESRYLHDRPAEPFHDVDEKPLQEPIRASVGGVAVMPDNAGKEVDIRITWDVTVYNVHHPERYMLRLRMGRSTDIVIHFWMYKQSIAFPVTIFLRDFETYGVGIRPSGGRRDRLSHMLHNRKLYLKQKLLSPWYQWP